MFAKDYSPLSQDEDSSEIEGFNRAANKKPWLTRAKPAIYLTLLASIALNLFSCSRLFGLSQARVGVTKFAGLSYNTPHVIAYRSQFNNPDRDAEDAAWTSKLVDPATLVVALDDSVTESWGVLHSMRWPWDSHKGVYTLNSAHELHCLHLLRSTVNSAYDNTTLAWPRHHSVHCLEYLLQSVMCNADDTPLYQGLLHSNKDAEHPLGGLGDTRKCRDWDQLQTWARQHSACYNPYYKDGDSTVPEQERYKFCPDGSKPWEHMSSRR